MNDKESGEAATHDNDGTSTSSSVPSTTVKKDSPTSGSSLTFKDFRNRDRPERSSKYKKKTGTTKPISKSSETLVNDYFKQDFGLQAALAETAKDDNDNGNVDDNVNDGNTEQQNAAEIDTHRRTVSEMRKDLRESQLQEKDLRTQLQELEQQQQQQSGSSSPMSRQEKLAKELDKSKAAAMEYQIKASELSVQVATNKAEMDDIQDALKFQQDANLKQTLANSKLQQKKQKSTTFGLLGGSMRNTATTASSSNQVKKATTEAASNPKAKTLDDFFSKSGGAGGNDNDANDANDANGDGVVLRDDDDMSTDFPSSFSVDHQHSSSNNNNTKSATSGGGGGSVIQKSLRRLQNSRQEAEIGRLTRRVDTLEVESEQYPNEMKKLEEKYEKAMKTNEEMQSKLAALEQRYGALHAAE